MKKKNDYCGQSESILFFGGGEGRCTPEKMLREVYIQKTCGGVRYDRLSGRVPQKDMDEAERYGKYMEKMDLLNDPEKSGLNKLKEREREYYMNQNAVKLIPGVNIYDSNLTKGTRTMFTGNTFAKVTAEPNLEVKIHKNANNLFF